MVFISSEGRDLVLPPDSKMQIDGFVKIVLVPVKEARVSIARQHYGMLMRQQRLRQGYLIWKLVLGRYIVVLVDESAKCLIAHRLHRLGGVLIFGWSSGGDGGRKLAGVRIVGTQRGVLHRNVTLYGVTSC